MWNITANYNIYYNISKYDTVLCGGGVSLCDLQGLQVPSGGADEVGGTVCDAQ